MACVSNLSRLHARQNEAGAQVVTLFSDLEDAHQEDGRHDELIGCHFAQDCRHAAHTRDKMASLLSPPCSEKGAARLQQHTTPISDSSKCKGTQGLC